MLVEDGYLAIADVERTTKIVTLVGICFSAVASLLGLLGWLSDIKVLVVLIASASAMIAARIVSFKMTREIEKNKGLSAKFFE